MADAGFSGGQESWLETQALSDVLLLTVAGMAGINASADLRTVIGPGAPTAAYWGQTAAIAVLVGVLWFLWYEEERTTMGRRVARKRK